MIKKSGISIFVIILFFSLSIVSVYAEQKDNLKDCLEQNEDCLDRDESPTEENNNEEINLADRNGTGSSFFLNILKMIFALALILGLIFFIAKLWNRKNNQLQQSNILENLGGIPLGQNKSMQIVRIGSRFYVIGVGENVQLLMEITDENIIDQFVQYEEESEDFKTIFQNMFQKTKVKSEEKNSNESFMATLSDELEQMKEQRKTIMNDKAKKDDQDE